MPRRPSRSASELSRPTGPGVDHADSAEEIVRRTLRTRRAEVERVEFGHAVAEAPQSREEDGVLVIPVVDEVLVIEKRLVLEEIRLRFVEAEETVERPSERRVQHATVKRVPSQEAGASAPGTVEWTGDNEEIT